jgi:hypothetical protein
MNKQFRGVVAIAALSGAFVIGCSGGSAPHVSLAQPAATCEQKTEGARFTVCSAAGGEQYGATLLRGNAGAQPMDLQGQKYALRGVLVGGVK